MSNGIYVAAAGAIARRTQLDITANNISNATTTGFRAQRITFQEVLSEQRAPNRHLVASSRTISSLDRGPIRRTGRLLDLSVSDEGFFVADDTGAGVLLRSVSAQVDHEGVLRDTVGRALAFSGSRPRLSPNLPTHIGEHGQVIQEGRELGRLLIVGVPDARALQPIGNGGYQPSAGSGQTFPIEGRVETGALEMSNVNTVTSMVNLINLERDFQSITRAIHAYREADEGIIATVTA